MADQIVQVGHACHESGSKFGCPDNSHLLVIGVANLKALQDAESQVSESVRTVCFFEPDDDMGFTCFATEPTTEDRKFRRWQLWK